MDEFASGMIGISSQSGRTGNAYDPTQNPGGSSGGPAAAVSANFAVMALALTTVALYVYQQHLMAFMG